MSDFLRSIKEENAKSTAEARQEQVRSDVRKRKKKYVLNDQEIMKAIGEFQFENDDADEKIYKFYSEFPVIYKISKNLFRHTSKMIRLMKMLICNFS